MAKGPSVSVHASVRLDAYGVISDRMEGVGAAAVRKFFKHRDKLELNDEEGDLAALGDLIDQYVMSALCDILVFDDPASMPLDSFSVNPEHSDD